jgi:hypothetical protein
MGLATIPPPWLIGGSALLIVAAFLAGRTLEPGARNHEKVVHLWCAVLAQRSSWSDHGHIRPGLTHPNRQSYKLVLAGAEETQCLQVSGEPGGKELYLDKTNHELAPLCGGNSYSFECKIVLKDGSEWLRLEGGNYWAPAAAFRPTIGVDVGELPRCSG